MIRCYITDVYDRERHLSHVLQGLQGLSTEHAHIRNCYPAASARGDGVGGKGSSINYVIADGGVSPQKITVLHNSRRELTIFIRELH